MKKYAAEFVIRGKYTVTTKAKDEDEAEDLAERSIWDADFGNVNDCYWEDYVLLQKKGDDYTFEYQMCKKKTIHFEAEDEAKARKKVEECYSSYSTGILEEPKFTINYVVERKQKDKEGRRLINEAFEALDKWFSEHETVETCFGTVSTKEGYDIDEIKVIKPSQTVMMSIYVLDRPVRENDEILGGDETNFSYNGKTKEIVARND